MNRAKSELLASLEQQAELARRRSQRLVEIAPLLSRPHDQNDLVAMALSEGKAAEVFDQAIEFLREQADPS